MAAFMQRWIKKKLNGSYTVEASFLIPIGFALVILAVSGCLIDYDQTALCARLHETAQKEAFQKTEEEHCKGTNLAGEKAVSAELENAAVSQIQIRVIKNNTDVIVAGTGNSRFLSSIIGSFFGIGAPNFEAHETVERIYGEQAVREAAFGGGT